MKKRIELLFRVELLAVDDDERKMKEQRLEKQILLSGCWLGFVVVVVVPLEVDERLAKWLELHYLGTCCCWS